MMVAMTKSKSNRSKGVLASQSQPLRHCIVDLRSAAGASRSRVISKTKGSKASCTVLFLFTQRYNELIECFFRYVKVWACVLVKCSRLAKSKNKAISLRGCLGNHFKRGISKGERPWIFDVYTKREELQRSKCTSGILRRAISIPRNSRPKAYT